MRTYLHIFVLMLLLHSCHSGMSNRGGFSVDQTAETDPCAGQTSPSPQCPDAGRDGDEKKNEDEEIETPADSGDQGMPTGPTQLAEYKDGMWGSITIDPLAMKKGEEAELKMTFTAAKAIEPIEGETQRKTPITLEVDFPHPNTGFILNKVEVSHADDKDFFDREPYIFTSPTTNKATVQMIKIAERDKYTLTFTITPQKDFEFKARTPGNRFFKNARGKMPKIDVYTGNTPPAVTYDLSPIYTNGKLEMRLKPWPHAVKKDTDSELTLTFTAVADLRKKGVGTHDVDIGITPYDATSTYRVKSVSPQKHFKDGKKPRCSLAHSCKLKIVKMQEGESFELTLTVNAKKDFSIGYLKKIPDEINPELDRKPPQIKVK